MAITPADIEQLTFSPSKHGYDTEEVDSFLEQLSSEVDAMLQKIADLKSRLNSAEHELSATQSQVQNLEQQHQRDLNQAKSAQLPQATASADQISRVMIVAQQSADKIVADAKEYGEQVKDEADQKARDIIRQALNEKQSEIDETERLKKSLEDFRKSYKELIQHFMDDADAVFPSSDDDHASSSASVSEAADNSYSAPAASADVDNSQDNDQTDDNVGADDDANPDKTVLTDQPAYHAGINVDDLD